jgi:WD40 repeat protein
MKPNAWKMGRTFFSARPTTRVLCAGLAVVLTGALSAAETSFTRDVLPILKHNCQSCHFPGKLKGKLDVTTVAAMKTGGKHGPAVVPGDLKSALLENVRGPDPKMPEDGDPLSAAEIATLEAWVRAGAVDDSAAASTGPAVAIEYHSAPVVTAVAFSPKGEILAVAGHNEVVLHSADGATLLARLPCDAPRIEAIAFSPDGKILAAAGGAPAQFGLIQFWEVESRKVLGSYRPANDSLFGLSISPDNTLAAFGCADKVARAVKIADGSQTLKFDNHADWVLCTVFTVDGKRLLTGSRDRAMKLVDLAHGQFIDDINKLLDPVSSFARHPKTDVVTYGSFTGSLRSYKISDNQNRTAANNDTNLVKEFERQPGPVRSIAYSPDGNTLAVASGATDVRLYKTDGTRTGQLDGHKGPIYTLAFQPDGKRIVTAGFEGEVRIFDYPSGKVVKSFVPVPVVAHK